MRGFSLVRAETRNEIRDFLTSRRAKLKAADVGLPDYGTRRVPGLRREEVAVLADVSVPYYTRLERGDLAGASDSDDAERAHLFDLERAAQPMGQPPRHRCSCRPLTVRLTPNLYLGVVGDDTWAGLADQFADEAYASVKGHVRTYVLHQQLLEHLPAPPAPVLDVGGGAGHQSFPLAQAGYDVTLLDPSQAMVDKAQQRLQRLPAEAQRRVTLLQADGENADEAVHGRRFAAVLCHGVLGYLEQPEPLVNQLCQCAAAGGVVSIMTGNAKAMAVRPALERRWDDALASFDARSEIGVLGVLGRADTVEELSELVRSQGVEPLRWYGVWLFVDWLDFSGAELDPSDSKQVAATAAVELEASRRDPYRQLSRVFHLVGRKGPG